MVTKDPIPVGISGVKTELLDSECIMNLLGETYEDINDKCKRHLEKLKDTYKVMCIKCVILYL